MFGANRKRPSSAASLAPGAASRANTRQLPAVWSARGRMLVTTPKESTTLTFVTSRMVPAVIGQRKHVPVVDVGVEELRQQHRQRVRLRVDRLVEIGVAILEAPPARVRGAGKIKLRRRHLPGRSRRRRGLLRARDIEVVPVERAADVVAAGEPVRVGLRLEGILQRLRCQAGASPLARSRARSALERRVDVDRCLRRSDRDRLQRVLARRDRT